MHSGRPTRVASTALVWVALVSGCSTAPDGAASAASTHAAPSGSFASVATPAASSEPTPVATPEPTLIPQLSIEATWPLGSACRSSRGRSRQFETTGYGMPGYRGYALLRPGDTSPVWYRSIPRGPMDPCDQRLVNAVRAFLPDHEFAKLTEIVVFDRDPRDSDADTVGFVSYDGGWQARMALGLDPYIEGGAEARAFVLAHELAHVLTYIDSHTYPQCPDDARWETCYGTPLYRAYLARFWGRSLRAEWRRIAGRDERLDRAQARTFRRRHPGRFVTDYAPTDPGEDLGEVLASWCLGHPPGSSQIRAQMAWVAARPELEGMAQRCAQLRARVR